MTARDTLVKYLRGAAIQARETGQLQEFSLEFLVDLAEAGVVLELPANGRDPELLSARQCARYADQLAARTGAASDQRPTRTIVGADQTPTSDRVRRNELSSEEPHRG